MLSQKEYSLEQWERSSKGSIKIWDSFVTDDFFFNVAS